MGPYSLLGYSSGAFGKAIDSGCTFSGTLMADIGRVIPMESEVWFSNSLLGAFQGRHGSTAPASERAYSLLRYSINPGRRTGLYGELFFTETLNAAAGAAVPLNESALFIGTIGVTLQGTVSLPFGMDSASDFHTQAEMRADILLEPEFSEELSQTSAAVKNIWYEAEDRGELLAKIWGSKDMPFSYASAAALQKRAYGSKNILREQVLFNTLNMLTEAATQQTEQVSVSITIPPGAELRIDSDAFRVTLNGVNILYAQSGDWIRVSRELLQLDIESASGSRLEGALVYMERYL